MGNDNDKPTEDIAHMRGISENLQDEYGAVNNSPVLKGFKIYDTICLGNLFVASAYNIFMGGIVSDGGSEFDRCGSLMVWMMYFVIFAPVGIVGIVANYTSTSSYKDALKKDESIKKTLIIKIIISVINVFIAIGLWIMDVMGILVVSGMAIAEIAAPVLVIIAIVAIIKAIGQSIQERKGDKQ